MPLARRRQIKPVVTSFGERAPQFSGGSIETGGSEKIPAKQTMLTEAQRGRLQVMCQAGDVGLTFVAISTRARFDDLRILGFIEKVSGDGDSADSVWRVTEPGREAFKRGWYMQ